MIVITDGEYDHAEVRDKDSNLQPLDLSALAKLLPDINAAAMEKIESHAAQIAALESTHTEAIAAKDAELAKLSETYGRELADRDERMTEIESANAAAIRGKPALMAGTVAPTG